PVFIQAGQEKRFLSETPPGPRDNVSKDFLVGMPEMWIPIDIINRGRDVKALAHLALLWGRAHGLATSGYRSNLPPPLPLPPPPLRPFLGRKSAAWTGGAGPFWLLTPVKYPHAPGYRTLLRPSRPRSGA